MTYSAKRMVFTGAVVPIFLACGGGRTGKETTPTSSGAREEAPPVTAPETPPVSYEYVDNNREIVPLLDPIPKPIDDSEKLPEDPALIRKEVSRLISDGNRSDALPLIDVLLILDPSDLEMLETRGRILVGQGLTEDGAVDLGRCCEEGRATCCH